MNTRTYTRHPRTIEPNWITLGQAMMLILLVVAIDP